MMQRTGPDSLLDVQSLSPSISLPIDLVGIRGLRFPVSVPDRGRGRQVCLANVELGTDLAANQKGTHMSRMVEELESWDGELSCQSLDALLGNLRARLGAQNSRAVFQFPYLVRQRAPLGKAPAHIAYDCGMSGEARGAETVFTLATAVPVMTVCPCSKAICEEGAHSQRALARMKIQIKKFIWIEDLVEIAGNAASSAVYTLLKRKDEKFVTEKAFSRPMFVEDVARNLAHALSVREGVSRFEVEVESMESIHNHNAFARIAGPRQPGDQI